MFEYLQDIISDELEASELTPKRMALVVLVGALFGALLTRRKLDS